MPHAVEQNDGNGRPDWWTPRPLAAAIVARFAINFDAFADKQNTVVDTFAGLNGVWRRDPEAIGGFLRLEDHDGFAASWYKRRVFLNPPYSRGFLPKVAEKIIAERQRAEIIVGLFMADTSTKFWREFVLDREHVEGITYLPRVQYELAPEELAAWQADRNRARALADKPQIANEMPGSPNFGSAVVLFRGSDYPIR